jgi:hypothetical protein
MKKFLALALSLSVVSIFSSEVSSDTSLFGKAKQIAIDIKGAVVSSSARTKVCAMMGTSFVGGFIDGNRLKHREWNKFGVGFCASSLTSTLLNYYILLDLASDYDNKVKVAVDSLKLGLASGVSYSIGRLSGACFKSFRKKSNI